jgi:MFS family permease
MERSLAQPTHQDIASYDSDAERRELKYGKNYKWIVLSNTTLGALMASIDASIVLISLPAIFNGLGVNPLVAANISLLIWMLLGYIIISAVIIVSVGRFADTFGRVRLYNLGFIIFAIASTLIWISTYLFHGPMGALSIILLRMVQAFGGAFLAANSAAMLTDAFPHNERGMALGINGIAFAGGSAIGLIVGGILAAIDWHLIFLISVPVGIVGAIWSYFALHEIATIKKGRKLDVSGNITFAISIGLILISITYALLPYGTADTGWMNPVVLGGLAAGLVLFVVFIFIEFRAPDPMFQLRLFKRRNFSLSMISLFLSTAIRFGLQFAIIIWLQGVWLPLHGISFENTPLLAAIYMLPLTLGFVVLGPLSGKLSDKYGPRIFATVGMLVNAAAFLLLAALPIDFSLVPFLVITFVLGLGQGIFLSPNIASIMNSLPPEQRGTGSGMRSTFMYVAMMFSMIIFFTLIVVGLGGTLPSAIYSGLVSKGVTTADAVNASNISPTAALFAAFLGYNPLKTILPQSLFHHINATQANTITGTEFFPKLISKPFSDGIHIVLYISAALALVAALASALMGKNDIYGVVESVHKGKSVNEP